MFNQCKKRIYHLGAAFVFLVSLLSVSHAQVADVALTAVCTQTSQTTNLYVYTEVTIQNIGSAPATNVVLTNYLPPELAPGGPMNFLSGQVADHYYYNGINGTLGFDNLAVGASASYRFVSRIKCANTDGNVLANSFGVTADVDGNAGNNSALFNITIDNPLPVFTVFPADINIATGPAATSCNATIADLGAYTVTDNCAIPTVTLTGVPAGNVFPVGTTVVTYTADDGGDQTVMTQNVTVTDGTPPLPDVATLPDVTLGLGMPVPTIPTATDNCAGSVTGMTTDPLSYSTPGTFVVTWTYDDGNGNTSTQTQNINVVVPDVKLTRQLLNVAITTGAYAYCELTIENVGTQTATNVIVTNTIPPEFAPGGPMNYLSGTPATSQYYVGQNATMSYASLAPGATSTYRFVSRVKCDVPDGTMFTNTFSAVADFDYDMSNNIVFAALTAINPAPTFTLFPSDISLGTGPGSTTCDVTIADLGAYTATDNCGTPTVTLAGVPAGNIFPVGTTVVTYTAADGGGGTDIRTQNITITDDTPPVPDVAPLPDVTVRYGMPVTAVPTATDNCAGSLNGTTLDPLTYGTPGTYTVTWTYDDGNGNTATQDQTIQVVAPDVKLSVTVLNSTLTTGTYGYFDLTIENVGTEAATNVVVTNTIPPQFAPGGPMNYLSGTPATSQYYVGQNGTMSYATLAPGATSTYRFVSRVKCDVPDGTVFSNNFSVVADVDYDNSNNAISASLTTINPGPSFTLFPSDISTGTGPGATTCDVTIADLGAYTATDNCGTPTVVLTGVPAGNIFPVGTTVVTYTATDAGGGTAVRTQTVTVADDTPPLPDVATLPDMTISFNAPITVFPTATDNCVGSLTATTTDPLVYATTGTYVVTWTYDDGNGNTATQTQNIIVVAPDIKVTAVPYSTTPTTGAYAYTEVTIENIGSENATNVVLTNYLPPELAPGGPMNFLSGQVATSQGYVGQNGTLSYATMAAGATSTYRFVQRVLCSTADQADISNDFEAVADTDYDNSNNSISVGFTAQNPAPTFTAFPADINVTTGVGAPTCDALVADLGAYTIDDNCAGTNVVLTGVPSGNIFPVGTTVVTYTATDAGGRMTVQTQNVTVSDDTPPVPDVATLPAFADECSYTVTTAPTATDNCAGTVTATTTQPLPWTFDTQGTFTITWTYDDGNGNTTTQDQQVIIKDVTAPVPDIASLPALTAECGYTVSVYPTATDNCTGTRTATTLDPLTYSTQGVFTVTWTYDDGNGNTSTQDQLVIIDDVTAPVPDVATLPIVTGECDATITATPTSTDNCVGQVLGTTTDPLTYSAQGTYTVTWTYDDGNGNVSTQDQTVIVDDVTAPVPNLTTLPDVTGECSATVTVTPTATDGCVGAVVGTTTDPLTYTSQGTFYVTWSYDDGNGNISTQVQTVIVDDVTAPVVTCAVGTIVEADNNGQAQVPDFTIGSSATDNCSASSALVWSQDPPAGTYMNEGVNTVTVYATDEAGNPGSCTTTFEVVPRVAIETDPDYVRVGFGCSSPLSFTRTVKILNGGGHYNGGQMVWNATTIATPITLTNSSGAEGDDLMFTVNPAGLAPGNYVYTITITAYNSATRVSASNSPYQFMVYVTVEPSNGTYTQTQAVGTSWTQFTNSYGQVFAEVKSNNGPISSFTATAYTCSYPPAYPRVNFVRRYFNFSASGSVDVDIRTYYTDTEKMPRVSQPQNLVLWQQPVSGGAWFNRGGSSNVLDNYVELTGVTSLSGNWLPAHPWAPWFPKALALHVTGTAFDLDSRTIRIDWRSMIETDAEGFTIERCLGSDPETDNWYEAGLIGFNGSGDYTFAEPVAELGRYHYRISTWDSEGNYYASPVITIEASDLPSQYALQQNYPNPFNPETVISYTLPVRETVSLKVYDLFWKEVATLTDGMQDAGTHEVRFDGSRYPSGTYFYQIKAGSFTMTKKMNLTK